MLSKRASRFGWVIGTRLVLILLALEVVGCRGPAQKDASAEAGLENEPAMLRVVPHSNKEMADLSPDDIVRVMQRIGFTDEQVIALGTALHNALLRSGAAAIVAGRKTEVLFAVNGEYLYIQSPLRGTFVYDLASGRFGLPTPRSSSPAAPARTRTR